jgi:hypothetical protein
MPSILPLEPKGGLTAMNSQNNPPQKSALKNPYLYSGIIFLGVVAYIAYILISRHESNSAYNRRAAEKAAEQQRAEDRTVIEQLGGSDLAIRTFYASPKSIHHGEKAQLCYDVDNAKTVTLDPPVAEVWPSHTRCFDVTPKRTTSYTLTIADSSGKTASQSVQLDVR